MRVMAALTIVLVGLTACGSDGDDTPTPTTASPSPGDGAPSQDLGTPADGAGRIVIGSLDVELSMKTCERDDAALPEGTAPAELVGIRATGVDEDGTPVLVDVRRFRTAGEVPTITDTVTVIEGPEDAPDSVLQAQRYEVAGVVSDARDPEADAPLLRLRAGAVTGEGMFAPPGAFADDEGLVEGRFVLGCER